MGMWHSKQVKKWYLVICSKWGHRGKKKQKVIYILWCKWFKNITFWIRYCKRKFWKLMEKGKFSWVHALTWVMLRLYLNPKSSIYFIHLNRNQKWQFIWLAPEKLNLCLNAPICKWQHGHFEYRLKLLT